MLQQEGIYNDLSKALYEKLEKQINSFGKRVRFRFDIANPDPDPEKRASGAVVWPFNWTLDPVTFEISDSLEDRPGKQKRKKVGIVESTKTLDSGITVADKFKRVRVKAGDKGIKTFDLEKAEDREYVALLLLHPKLEGGEFADKEKRAIVTRIDEVANAQTQSKQRSARKIALDAVELMGNQELVDFANAMSWDGTQEPEVLRNEIEFLAEQDPTFFNDLVKDEKIQYRATVKKAMLQGVIEFDPITGSFKFASNNQPITSVKVLEDKNEVVALAEWLMGKGAKEIEIYKKLTSMLNKPAMA